MIQQTSREAYRSILPFKARMQRTVLEAFGEYAPACNEEIAKKLRKTINRITGRTRELYKKGLLKKAYKETYLPTGRTVIFWELTKQGRQVLK